jgi:hypothetical protein
MALSEYFRAQLERIGINLVKVSGSERNHYPSFPRGVKLAGTTLNSTNIVSKKIHSNAAVSSDLSATTLTTFSNGTATIDADELSAGDVIRIRAIVRVKTVDGTDSLRVYLKYAGATILDTTAIGSVIQDDKIIIDAEVTVRTVHASTGTAYFSAIVSGDLGATGYSGSAVIGALSSLANAADHAAIVQAIWGGAGNAAVLEQFNVYKN